MFLMQQSFWDKVNYWMSQSSDNWQTLSAAMDYNPILIGIHVISGFIMAVSFFTISFLILHGVKQKGFFSQEQKRLTLFFIVFICLCGTTFLSREIMFVYPLYWVYGAIKGIAALFAGTTAFLYLKNYKRLLESPSSKEWKSVIEELRLLKKENALLKSHVDAWNKNMSLQISFLSGLHTKYKESIDTPSDLHSTEDSTNKKDALDTLERIKRELEILQTKFDE
jgi:hypothetical protein